MLNIIFGGVNGRMGRVFQDLIADKEDVALVAGVDVVSADCSFPVFSSFEDVNVKCDVVVDFSNPSALDGILAYCKKNQVPAVLCATGYSEEQLKAISEASKEIPMFRSSNMSVGVNIISELAKKAAALLYPDFNVEIVEKHHTQKLDAPSGTAIMIADSIASGLPEKVEYVYDRSQRRATRPENEIGISAVRGGTIVGEHDVILAGPDEVITLSHHAASRAIFANGALSAAKWISDKEPGLYNMSDVLGLF